MVKSAQFLIFSLFTIHDVMVLFTIHYSPFTGF